jgi:hypothetical protein
LLLTSILFVPPALAQEEEGEKGEWNHFEINEDVSFSLNGYLYLYHIRNHHSYHQQDLNAAFTETTGALGIDFQFQEDFSGQFRIVGRGISGRPNGYVWVRDDLTSDFLMTGNNTVDSDLETMLDLANVTWSTALGETPVDITAGYQELIYGDGFLIMDGYSEKLVPWTNPILSFPAVKASFALSDNNTLDIFTADIRNDFITMEAFLESGMLYNTGGSLHGINFHMAECGSEEVTQDINVGLYYKDERSNTQTGSDTLSISFRDALDCGQFKLTGEIVRQYGQTRVSNGMPVNRNLTRRAWGGHLTGRFDIDKDEPTTPYVEAAYIYFGGDSSSSNYSEAFDPMFYGWGDWGKWWIGDMTSFMVPHSNARILKLEGGWWLTEMSQLRLMFFDTNLNRRHTFSRSRQWSEEFNVIYDYYFSDHVFAGLMVGANLARGAAEDWSRTVFGESGGSTTYESIAWFGFAF